MEDSPQSQEELALTLTVTQQTISHALKIWGMLQKEENWLLYVLESSNVKHRKMAGINKKVFASHKGNHNGDTSPCSSTWTYKMNSHGKNSNCVLGGIGSSVINCLNRTSHY